jgi:hypothetical protein
MTPRIERVEGTRGKVLTRMGPLVSDHRLQFLMELSIEPVAAVLRAADTAATPA